MLLFIFLNELLLDQSNFGLHDYPCHFQKNHVKMWVSNMIRLLRNVSQSSFHSNLCFVPAQLKTSFDNKTVHSNIILARHYWSCNWYIMCI